MAVRNPEALYGGNANVFNFTPFIQYSQRQQAIKKAKEDAADNYFRDLTKGLTPTGMAANDIKSFVDKKNAAQNYVIQNRGILRNPRDPRYADTLNEANYRFNDALEHAERSKAKVRNLVAGQKLLSNPEMRNRLSENTLEGLRKQGAPVDSQDYADYDYADLNFKAKPFDNKMQQGYLKGATQGLTMGDLIEDVVTDPKTLKATTSIKSTYNPDALQAINSRAEAAYYGDPSVKEFVDANLSNPEMHDRLNNIFKSTYGVDIQNPSELFTAWTLDAVQNEKNNQKQSDNKKALMDLNQQYKLAFEKYKQAGKVNLAKLKQGFKKENIEAQGYITEGYLKDLKDKQDEGVLPNTTELLKMGARQGTDGKMIQPDNVFINSNGDVKFIFNHRDSNGKLIKDDNNIVETTTEIMPRQAVKNNLAKEWTTGKQRIAEMTQPKEAQQPKKETKKNDPLGLF